MRPSFVCFQSDPNAGFLAAQARLDDEPLDERVKPIGGGDVLLPPGGPVADSLLGTRLLEAADGA